MYINMTHETLILSRNVIFIAILIFSTLNESCLAVFRDHVLEESNAGEKEPIPESQQSVVDCRLGKPHRRYTECRCGEYAVVVPEEEILDDNLGDFHVRTIEKMFKKNKVRYYFCSFCSICPDGVRTKSNCTQLQDTQCSNNNECINPDHVFDNGRKACVPKHTPHRITTTTQKPADTTRPPTSKITDGSLSSRDDPIGRAQEKSFSQPLLLDEPLLILGGVLICAMLIVLVINIQICLYFRNQKRADEDRDRIISRATSTNTLTDV